MFYIMNIQVNNYEKITTYTEIEMCARGHALHSSISKGYVLVSRCWNSTGRG